MLTQVYNLLFKSEFSYSGSLCLFTILMQKILLYVQQNFNALGILAVYYIGSVMKDMNRRVHIMKSFFVDTQIHTDCIRMQLQPVSLSPDSENDENC